MVPTLADERGRTTLPFSGVRNRAKGTRHSTVAALAAAAFSPSRRAAERPPCQIRRTLERRTGTIRCFGDVMTGSTLSGTMIGFMRSAPRERSIGTQRIG